MHAALDRCSIALIFIEAGLADSIPLVRYLGLLINEEVVRQGYR